VGACWTKRHRGDVGEIYVIAVCPEAQGRSIGTALTLRGLWDLFERRSATVGMLYTDTTNRPARALYEGLGFEVARVIRFLGRGKVF
jgi:mycothiol synthase